MATAMTRFLLLSFLMAWLSACDSDDPAPPSGPLVWRSSFDFAADLADGLCLGTGLVSTGGFECQQLAGGTLLGTRKTVTSSWIQVDEPAGNWWAAGPAGWYSYSNGSAPALVSSNVMTLGNAASGAFTTTVTAERANVAGRDLREVLAELGVAGDYNLSLTLSAGDAAVPAGATFPAGARAYRVQRHDDPAAPLLVIAGDAAAVAATGGAPADIDALLAAYAEGNAADDWLPFGTLYTPVGGPGGMVAPWAIDEIQFRSGGTATARRRWLDSRPSPLDALADLDWSRQTISGQDVLRLDIASATEADSMRWLRGTDAPWHSATPGATYWVARSGQVYPAIVSPVRADRTLYLFNRVAADALMPYFTYP